MRSTKLEKMRKAVKAVKSARRRTRRKIVRPARPSSLYAGAYRTIVRVVWDVGNGVEADGNVASYNIDVGYIFPNGHQGLAALFKSVKIHSMTARFYPAVMLADQVGFTTMCFADIDEVPTSASMINILASPGNTVAQTGKIPRCRWHPTEPSDRDFIDMISSKGHTWARLNLAIWPEKESQWITVHSVKNHLYGKIITDIDCTLRGHGKRTGYEACDCEKCKTGYIVRKYPNRHVIVNGVVAEVAEGKTSIVNAPTPSTYRTPWIERSLEPEVAVSPTGDEFERLEI